MLALSRAAVAATSRVGMNRVVRPGGSRKAMFGLRVGVDKVFKAGRPSFSSTQLADFSTTGSSPPQKEEKESQQQQQAPPQQPAQSSFVADLKDAAIAATGCFIGIGTLATIHYDFMDGSPYTMVLGSMGATAVLVFGAPAAPFSQPWNVVAGHLVSAVCGIAAYQYIGVPMESLQVALPVAAAASIFAMKVGKCVHPPAGGTTLIAVLGSAQIHALGWSLLIPVSVGSVALVALGMMNNVVGRKYPN